MYNYGGSMMKIWMFLAKSEGTGYNPPVAWYTNYTWDATRTKNFVSSDFNGDGKDDLAAMYDYGGSMMKIWVFNTNDTANGFVSPESWYTNYTWDTSRSKSVTADKDGNINLLYDYGGGMMRIWQFRKTGHVHTGTK
jgi:hypothetical protein